MTDPYRVQPSDVLLERLAQVLGRAASVLADPVGAAMRACRPSRIAGQASIWQGVGAANRPENQFRTAG